MNVKKVQIIFAISFLVIAFLLGNLFSQIFSLSIIKVQAQKDTSPMSLSQEWEYKIVTGANEFEDQPNGKPGHKKFYSAGESLEKKINQMTINGYEVVNITAAHDTINQGNTPFTIYALLKRPKRVTPQ